MIASALALALSLSVTAAAEAEEPALPPLPKGWSVPRPIKKSICSKGARFAVRADFDGDGKEETALMLTKDDRKSLGVWVWLASKKAPLLVATFDAEDGKHEMGIGLVDPGEFKTACGKGYWECKDGEPATLTLKTAAIDIFVCESSDTYAWWNAAKKKFQLVAITD